MFSKYITNSDVFLDLPNDAKVLYFYLGMEADDDGFVAPKRVVRMLGVPEDNLKLLIVKGYVIPFEDGVVVITHWKKNNDIRTDRYKETDYLEDKSKLHLSDGVYGLVVPVVVPVVDQMDTQVRLGKDRLSNNIYNPTSQSEDRANVAKSYRDFIDFFNELTGRKFRYSDKKAERQLKARLKDGYTREDFEVAIKAMLQDPYHKETTFRYMTPEFITRSDKLERYREIGDKVKHLVTGGVDPEEVMKAYREQYKNLNS